MSSQQIHTLTAAITSDIVPFCSGVLNPPAQSFTLYFGGEENPHRINLANASPEVLQKLSTACEAATFGVGGENVLDESYRKAGKLDNTNFATLFDPVRLGLIETIQSHLSHDEKNSIDVELYKLNVYGEGSFFKPHKDTPRGENMFGSLVVVFPTPHSGGELMLRHQGQEWKFDPSSLMFHTGATSQGSGGTSVPAIKGPLISYIAFYSDVEHEVLKVTSGSRVTITYNLYFSEANAGRPSAVIHSTSNTAHLGSALTALLHDPTFLPDGGKLGFGMTHQYPISKGTNLAALIKCLKGADAIIHRASAGLGLAVSLKMVYNMRGPPQVMMDEVVDMDGRDFEEADPSGALIQEGGVAINYATRRNHDYQEYPSHETITWVTDLTKMNEMKSTVMTYGNEASMYFVYGDLCLFVSVGPSDHRATA